MGHINVFPVAATRQRRVVRYTEERKKRNSLNVDFSQFGSPGKAKSLNAKIYMRDEHKKLKKLRVTMISHVPRQVVLHVVDGVKSNTGVEKTPLKIELQMRMPHTLSPT